MIINERQVHWFIHEGDQTPLGFIRMKNGGALIIGGKTGGHATGHGESYWNKIKQIISLGYMPIEIAKEVKLIPQNWHPPEIESPTEREWIEKIIRGEM